MCLIVGIKHLVFRCRLQSSPNQRVHDQWNRVSISPELNLFVLMTFERCPATEPGGRSHMIVRAKILPAAAGRYLAFGDDPSDGAEIHTLPPAVLRSIGFTLQ